MPCLIGANQLYSENNSQRTWLVARDTAAQSHCYRRDVDLAIDGDTIAAIGPALPADHSDAIEIDGRGFATLPGFVDIPAHPLLRYSTAAARERRLPLQIHAAQSVVEFREIMRRHGKTPIAWLRQIEVLGDHAIIGHANFS
jgi:cytosine/adenosine deaminase-related metal-dependent hydrolase